MSLYFSLKAFLFRYIAVCSVEGDRNTHPLSDKLCFSPWLRRQHDNRLPFWWGWETAKGTGWLYMVRKTNAPLQIYFFNLSAQKSTTSWSDFYLSISGIFMFGTSLGLSVLICPMVTMDGRHTMPHHKKQVMVRSLYAVYWQQWVRSSLSHLFTALEYQRSSGLKGAWPKSAGLQSSKTEKPGLRGSMALLQESI